MIKSILAKLSLATPHHAMLVSDAFSVRTTRMTISRRLALAAVLAVSLGHGLAVSQAKTGSANTAEVVFDGADLDQLPVPIAQAAPKTSYEMWRKGVNGSVTVEFVITSAGDVTKAKVVESSHREFDNSALQAVAQWKYKPGQKNGQSVATRCKLSLEFNVAGGHALKADQDKTTKAPARKASAQETAEVVFDLADLDQLPIVTEQLLPEYPYEMLRAGVTGWVNVEFVVTSSGDVESVTVVKSSHREFESVIFQAVPKWKFKPGAKDGRRVAVRLSQRLEFNEKGTVKVIAQNSSPAKKPAQDSDSQNGVKQESQKTDAPPALIVADEGPALLRKWVQPVYPEAAAKAKKEGRVMVEFIVELDGTVSRASVTKSSDAKFDATALAAVQQWTFSPGISDKKSVVMAMRVPVVFRLTQLTQTQPPLQPAEAELPVPIKRVSAKMKVSPNPDYPGELAETGLSGRVDLEFTVGVDGVAHAPKVLWTSHAAFVAPALAALAGCEFEPAHQGPLQYTELQQAPMEFGALGIKRAGVLAANHITVVTSPVPSVLPAPVVLLEPVYPLARLLAGESGEATVDFALTDRAKIEDIKLITATEPEYGAALLAAVATWEFGPAMHEGARVPVILRVTYPFTPMVGGQVGRLVKALQPGGDGVGTAKGLDRPLAPLWRVAPLYPAARRAERVAGQATVEFLIDEEGRVRLPKVVSASHEDFGWAAQMAISQWVFAPPRRGGQLADVRVSIPINFPAPKE